MGRWMLKVRQCCEESLIGVAGSEFMHVSDERDGQVLKEQMMNRHVSWFYEYSRHRLSTSVHKNLHITLYYCAT